VAKIVLDKDSISFANSYTILFALAFILMSISYIALGSVKETAEEVHDKILSFRQFLKKTLSILKSDKNYRKFIYIQILIGANTLALPFYIIYAKEEYFISLGMVGIFIAAKMFGRAISNLLWAYVADFFGNKRLFQISILLGMSVPVLALLIPAELPGLFIVLFILSGFCISGVQIGKNSFLLDIAPSKDRLAYIGLNSSLTFIIMFFPFLGGIILDYLNYKVLFYITFLLIFLAFITSFTLNEKGR